jgi:hypothetical protein
VSLADAFAEGIAIQRAEATCMTFGHLAPEPGRTYAGSILFAHGEYGDYLPIRTDFPELPDSPWFFEGMCDFILDHGTEGHRDSGDVFWWTGTYSFAADEETGETTHRFDGEVVKVKIQGPSDLQAVPS